MTPSIRFRCSGSRSPPATQPTDLAGPAQAEPIRTLILEDDSSNSAVSGPSHPCRTSWDPSRRADIGRTGCGSPETRPGENFVQSASRPGSIGSYFRVALDVGKRHLSGTWADRILRASPLGQLPCRDSHDKVEIRLNFREDGRRAYPELDAGRDSSCR